MWKDVRSKSNIQREIKVSKIYVKEIYYFLSWKWLVPHKIGHSFLKHGHKKTKEEGTF